MHQDHKYYRLVIFVSIITHFTLEFPHKLYVLSAAVEEIAGNDNYMYTTLGLRIQLTMI